MNIPNILTLFRLLLIPVFILAFFSSLDNNLTLSIFIFITAGLTDVLDGYVARKFNWITDIGIVLDPLADKLMLITVLSCLVLKGFIPSWILLIIALKEFLMILFGIILYRKQILIPSNKFGKVSTFLFYISIFTLSIDEAIGKPLLYMAVVSALFAFVNYILRYIKDKKVDQQ